MNVKITRNTQALLISLYMLIGFAFLFQMNSVDSQYTVEYLVVLLSYFVMTGIWIHYIIKYGFYIFEPVTMVAVLTIMTFSIEPLVSMITHDTLLMGFDVYAGCIKATLLYVVGLSIFFIVYYNNFKWGSINLTHNIQDTDSDINDFVWIKNPLVTTAAYVFVLIGVGISLLDLIKQGFSLSYILSFGSEGSLDTSEDSVGVFINLRYMMLSGFLYLDACSESKFLKNALRFVAIACMFMRNKRWVIILLVLSPMVFYYLRKKKSPPLKLLVFVALIMMIVIGAMQYMRGVSTSISAVDWGEFDVLSIWRAFSGNFDLYKTLYGAVTYFPEQHNYTFGQQLVYLTIVTCIPRAIWPNKPVSIIDNELKVHFLGAGAVRGHWAYAQLTEFYIEFGICGIIICMIIFACFCKYLRKCTYEPHDIHDEILAATMFPMLMQLVIRGYMPINFWAMFFMCIPIFCMRFICRTKIKGDENE